MNENNFSDHTSQSTLKSTTILMRMKQNLAQTFSRLDWKIISLTSILIIIGLVSVFSATMPNDPVGTLRTQIFAITLGVIAGLVILSVPSKWLTDSKCCFSIAAALRRSQCWITTSGNRYSLPRRHRRNFRHAVG